MENSKSDQQKNWKISTIKYTEINNSSSVLENCKSVLESYIS